MTKQSYRLTHALHDDVDCWADSTALRPRFPLLSLLLLLLLLLLLWVVRAGTVRSRRRRRLQIPAAERRAACPERRSAAQTPPQQPSAPQSGAESPRHSAPLCTRTVAAAAARVGVSH
jgi:hypothetical protein